MLNLLFEIFEEAGIIEILEKTPDFYVVKLCGNAEISSVLHNSKYSELLNLIDENEQFQRYLLEEEVVLS